MPPVILITGSTDGIGKQTATELVRRGAQVIIHGRSESRCIAVQQEIAAHHPDARVDYVTGDLSSLQEVRTLAEGILRSFPRVDVLINNAGVFMTERRLSVDGVEMTFAVNHLAPFLLTHLLVPRLTASPDGRVITVSSIAHRNGSIDLLDLNSERSFSGYSAYATSKLANILFTTELARRQPSLSANCLHPGVVNTKLLRVGFSGVNGNDSLEQGAETSVHCALSEEVKGVSGKYFQRKRAVSPSASAMDDSTAAALWEKSELLCGLR